MGGQQIYRIGIFVLAFAATVLGDGPATRPAAKAPAKAVERKSAEGVAFPEVVNPNPPFKIKLPFIGERLGGIPEDFGARIHNTAAAGASAPARVRSERAGSEWYCVSLLGADCVGFDLVDGRVSRIQLHYLGSHQSPLKALENGIKSMSPKVVANATVEISLPGETEPCVRIHATSEFIEFSFLPVHLYLKTHDVKPEIAKAMRDGKPAMGMTLEQAKILFGEPESSEDAPQGTMVHWETKIWVQAHSSAASYRAVQVNPWLTDLSAPSVTMVEVPDRRIFGAFRNGVMFDFSDEKIKR